MSTRSEAPTPKRLEDARRKGQFARAPALTSWTSLVGAGAGLMLAVGRAAAETRSFAQFAWVLEGRADDVTLRALNCLLWWALPVATGAFLGALVGAGGQAGWRPELGLVLPDLSRLSPEQGLRRLFSLERLGTLTRATVFALVVACAWRSSAREFVPQLLLRNSHLEACSWVSLFGAELRRGVQAVFGLGLVYVLVESAAARHRHQARLRMTRDEVRREFREREGDPAVKGQRRAIHRSLAQGGPARGLAKASAVVVNPTHLAVALRYEPGECEAPYVVARGREGDALAMRLEAEALGLPVIRDVPLARSLIRLEPGEEIPEELYQAAAVVLKLAQEGGRP